MQPDVIVHQLTSIGPMDLRHFDRAFAMTNRLRTEGTDHLVAEELMCDWNKVVLDITSHAAGGVTGRCFELAAEVDRALGE